MQINESPESFDVITVGSGVVGGMVTKILSESGLSIAVIEAGPFYDPANPEQQNQLNRYC